MIKHSAMTGSMLLLLLLGSVAARADSFREVVVGFTSHDGHEIECILSSPDSGPGPFPGMLMLAGGGLHDADVTLHQPALEVTTGEQRLFRPLARFFSRHGWAVLRCNKRGASFGHQDDRPRVLESSDLADLVQDARDALATLKGHPRVDARPLVVFGHSEGTMIASRLAVGRTDIDLLVLVGSVARAFDELIEYQLVDRNLHFLHLAADRNRDGSLTLGELDSLDGDHGLGSVYVRNSSNVLFDHATMAGPDATRAFNPTTDRNGDGRLQITAEIDPALRAATAELLDMARTGSLGEYWLSLVTAPAPESMIDRLSTPILFIHGALDVQTPLDEALTLMARLESRGRSDYEILVFPDLGHSLSRPNDYFRDDGGLSILDNLTLNAPSARTRRKLLDRIEAALVR